jgi:eukaryotic-like serine/threonine-protein kinase
LRAIASPQAVNDDDPLDKGLIMRRQLSETEWEIVSAKFDALVGQSSAERDRQLGPPCDPVIAQNVRSLLDAVATDGILDGAPPSLSSDTLPSAYRSLADGTRIGAFEIGTLIGRGGMGEVYAAHRVDAEFEQRVALKILRPEAVSQTDLFDRERRLLARLDHPGIARLIDGGMTPDGRPFMAMEYVSGEPIDVWCRNQRASLEARLRLICDVCKAVSYAHANLIVHRDLKPSNILVDSEGRVRLLDFGIAKIIDDNATLATTTALMTPDYAAPEQLGDATPTVATDVYALGAVLFELLAGRGAWRSEGASLPSIIRRVLADDPPLPSTLVAASDLPYAASAVAGDLDAIVMKAMRRKPHERYASVAALADDIGRYLELKPVAARGGSTSYTMARFVRRHRLPVAAAAAALLAILVGAGGIAWQARQTAIERDIALSEARRSESIVRMLTVMFRDTAASDAGETATVKQMLDQTAKNLVGSVDTSAKSASLIATLFDLYVNVEDSAGADTLIRQALAKGIGKDDSFAFARLKMRAATAAAALGRTEDMAPLLDAAEPVFRQDPDRYRYELVDLAMARAQLFRRTGKLPEAIDLLTNVLPAADIAYAENHRDLLTLYSNLLVYMSEANRLDAMPAVFERADAVLKRTGQEASMQGLTITQLKGLRLLKLDQPVRAEAILAGVLAQRRAVFGKSAGLSVDMLQLGRAKMALGKFAEAQRIFGEARPMASQYLSPTAAPTLIIGIGLAEAAAENGDTKQAQAVLDEIAPLVAAAKKPGIPNGLLARAQAVVRLKSGDAKAAAAALDEADAIFTALGPSGASYLKGSPALRARIAKGR